MVTGRGRGGVMVLPSWRGQHSVVSNYQQHDKAGHQCLSGNTCWTVAPVYTRTYPHTAVHRTPINSSSDRVATWPGPAVKLAERKCPVYNSQWWGHTHQPRGEGRKSGLTFLVWHVHPGRSLSRCQPDTDLKMPTSTHLQLEVFLHNLCRNLHPLRWHHGHIWGTILLAEENDIYHEN